MLGVVNVPDPTPVVTSVTSVPGAEKSGAGEKCRAEPVCMKQCDPNAYKFDVATAGADFPYSVSYTTTNDASVTTFIFNVCSKFGALCSPGNPTCAPLKSFNLRIKDIMIDTGATILANPGGQNWASCRPRAPATCGKVLPSAQSPTPLPRPARLWRSRWPPFPVLPLPCRTCASRM